MRPQLLINGLIMLLVVVLARRRKLGPSLSYAAGLGTILTLVIVHNSVASHQLTGFATNGGLNFWFGHCDATQVQTISTDGRRSYSFGHPVPIQAGRPGAYTFTNRDVWDEDFFVDLGKECIRADGPGHVFRLARNVLDMTATTTPWPQSGQAGWARDVVQAANVLYSVLLPWIVIESVCLWRRRRKAGSGWNPEAFLLLNLAGVLVVAVAILGDPRVRTVYDVFGFALLAALLSDRLRLDVPDDLDSEPAPTPTEDAAA